MTNSRRDSRICLTLALLCIATAVYLAVHHSWWAPFCVYVALLLGWCERRLTADHRRQVAHHERARAAAACDAEVLGPPGPCCQFWTASKGEVHGPDCTRPTSRSSAA